MSEPRPTLQFDLDLEAVRLLHRSVSFHLEKWPGGPDPREQANSFKVQIELEGGTRLTHGSILPNTTLTTKRTVSST